MDALTIKKTQTIGLRFGDEGESVQIDPLECYEAICDAQEQFEKPLDRTRAMREWFAARLNMDPNEITLDEAATASDTIISISEAMIDDRKKKVSETATSLLSTLGYQTTSGNGRGKKKTPGLRTSPGSKPRSRSRKAGSTTTARTGSTKRKKRGPAMKKRQASQEQK